MSCKCTQTNTILVTVATANPNFGPECEAVCEHPGFGRESIPKNTKMEKFM